MNQYEIGKFISERRKEKSLTQKQLAEQVGVTDKAVSKWETGMRMPDASILMELCQILEVDMNELLAGKTLQEAEYSNKAETNLVELVNEINTIREDNKVNGMGIIAGIAFMILAIAFIMVDAVGIFGLTSFLDIHTLLWLLGLTYLLVALVGYFRDYIHSFKICFSNKAQNQGEIEAAILALNYSCLIALTVGILMSVIGGIAVLGHMFDVSSVGPALAQMVLSIFYTMLYEMIHLSIMFRIKRLLVRP